MSHSSTSAPMSIEDTRAVITRYLASGHSDLEVMDPDVVFTVMATGQEFRGPAAIAAMLSYFYQQAFEADAINERLVVGEGRAVGEWDFVGRHIGEFAGIPATNKQVRVPLAVAYDLADGRVTHGRVYFETPAFLAQVAG